MLNQQIIRSVPFWILLKFDGEQVLRILKSFFDNPLNNSVLKLQCFIYATTIKRHNFLLIQRKLVNTLYELVRSFIAQTSKNTWLIFGIVFSAINAPVKQPFL